MTSTERHNSEVGDYLFVRPVNMVLQIDEIGEWSDTILMSDRRWYNLEELEIADKEKNPEYFL